MSIEENKARDRRLVEDVLNRGNLAVADELIASDFFDHAAPPGMQHGPDGFKAAVAAFRSAFPDLHVTVEEQVGEGDRVVRRMTMRGTHRGELFGIPATDQPMAMTGIHLVRLAGGKLVEHRGINDDMGMLQQLGVIPAPGPAEGAAPGGRPARAHEQWAASVEENKALARRVVSAFQEVWRTGAFDLVDPLFAPDFINHTPGFPPDLAGFKQAMPMFRSAFPDLRIDLEDLIAEKDKVAIRITNRGTHQGELMGIPPTGKAIAVSEMHLYRIADGKVVERWGEWDALGLMQQLGAIRVAA